MSTRESRYDIVSSVNVLSHFLSDLSTEPLSKPYKTDTIVICASAVLHGVETIFRRLADGSLTAKTLVLCGGIGHSTQLIWDAVARHPEYSVSGDAVRGKPEARVLEMILDEFFDRDGSRIRSRCHVLVEDQSTNCGSNAKETRKVLEAAAASETDLRSSTPEEIMIVQDPTMALRTRASFQKVYESVSSPPSFISFPVFVPEVETLTKPGVDGGASTMGNAQIHIRFTTNEVLESQLWDMNRFLELILGEIPRIRDDKNGYGPNGRGFIAHIDVPDEIGRAWARVREEFGGSR